MVLISNKYQHFVNNLQEFASLFKKFESRQFIQGNNKNKCGRINGMCPTYVTLNFESGIKIFFLLCKNVITLLRLDHN